MTVHHTETTETTDTTDPSTDPIHRTDTDPTDRTDADPTGVDDRTDTALVAAARADVGAAEGRNPAR